MRICRAAAEEMPFPASHGLTTPKTSPFKLLYYVWTKNTMFQSQIGPSTSVPAAEPIWASKVCKKKIIIMKQKEKKLKGIFYTAATL